MEISELSESYFYRKLRNDLEGFGGSVDVEELLSITNQPTSTSGSRREREYKKMQCIIKVVGLESGEIKSTAASANNPITLNN